MVSEKDVGQLDTNHDDLRAKPIRRTSGTAPCHAMPCHAPSHESIRQGCPCPGMDCRGQKKKKDETGYDPISTREPCVLLHFLLFDGTKWIGGDAFAFWSVQSRSSLNMLANQLAYHQQSSDEDKKMVLSRITTPATRDHRRESRSRDRREVVGTVTVTTTTRSPARRWTHAIRC